MIFPGSGLKRKRQRLYTILFFSDEDEKPKGVKLSKQALIAYITLVVIFISAIVLVLVIHTPVKYIVFPETFAESRERAKKMQELYQRLENFAYELEKVKLYNNLLRQALGEKVSDSIAVSISRLENMSQKKQMMFEENGFDVLQVIDIESVKPKFIFPVFNGFITRGFDPNIQHFGIDIAGKEGDVVRAVDDGYVIFSDWTYRDGYVIIILHSGGYMSVYKHGQMNLKARNSFVKQGEAIALVGKTGKTGNEPHLHFEIWKNGKPLNPKFYIPN
ncbi:Peptidase family M23 [Candidatus Kryptobacter tengchongensis]|nr:Peptidase family M23 [Candidatus Kryptobacter tengchongensis]CUU03453.1 Peptidase family M23 [Candidatus Kryptobacter tengchongensis]